MKLPQSLSGFIRELRDASQLEKYHTPIDTDCRVTANVGSLIELALATAGRFMPVPGGRVPCETDYLAASGATFPDVPQDQLVLFNRRTLKANMTENDEFARYVKIADFFVGRTR